MHMDMDVAEHRCAPFEVKSRERIKAHGRLIERSSGEGVGVVY